MIFMFLSKNINFNIVLCGFMGCGKTSVGKQLSLKTGLNFIDTDRYIEKTSGLPVSEIFKVYGEAHFRNLEKICVKTVSSSTSAIISTGGGVILDKKNILYLKQTGKIFYLDAPIEILTARLISDSTRPLIKSKSSIQKIFDERKEKYFNAADFIINANQSLDEVCEDIINKIEKTVPK